MCPKRWRVDFKRHPEDYTTAHHNELVSFVWKSFYKLSRKKQTLGFIEVIML